MQSIQERTSMRVKSIGYKDALIDLLEREGLYSDDPKDKGGETAYGISKVHHPSMWVDGRPTLEDARVFYWNTFWFPLRCGNFTERVGEELFDSGVNAGRTAATEWLQKAYNLVVPEHWRLLKVDGAMGPKTQAAVNRFSSRKRDWECALVAAMNGYQFVHYERQNDHHHIRGWLSKRVGGYGT